MRLYRDGSVPAGNPFVGRAGALPEVYCLGHRNAQGLAFDAATHGVDHTGARITPFTAPLLHWTPSIAPSSLAIYWGQPFRQWDGDLLSAA